MSPAHDVTTYEHRGHWYAECVTCPWQTYVPHRRWWIETRAAEHRRTGK